ncbi:MAG: polysaccharide biosynthesis protein, partial [Pedobacter sp.]
AENPINAFFDDPAVYPIIFKCSAVLFFNGLTLLNTEVFRAMGFNYLSEMFRNIIKYVPVITGAILLLIIHQENYLVDFYIFGFVVLGLITTGMVFYYLNRIEHGEQTPRISVKEIVVTSYPIAMSGMAVFLLMGIDIMLLKKYQGSEVVAYYGVAVKLMTMLSVIVVTVNVTLSTKIAELFTSGDHSALREKVKSGSKLIFLLTSPAAAVICIFPETILHLFGEHYESARDALIILTVSQWICSYFGVVTVYLNMTRKQHIFQYILIVAVIINFIMNSLLIPEYGMTGAAISFAVSILFWNIVSAIVIYKTDKLNLFWI